MPLAEEQPEFIGNCRHCQTPMYLIDGKIKSFYECTSDGHQGERRKEKDGGKSNNKFFHNKGFGSNFKLW